MIRLILFITLCLMQSCSRDRISGTATDTNSGSICGSAKIANNLYRGSIDVTLIAEDSVVKTETTVDGNFEFDSLKEGRYSINIYNDSVLIGKNSDIFLEVSEKKKLVIQVVILVKQYFYITYIENNQNVKINSYSFIGSEGKLNSNNDGELVATFPELDTVIISLGIVNSGEDELLKIEFVKNIDGTYSTLPIVLKPSLIITNNETVKNAGTGSDSVLVLIRGKVYE